MQASTAAVQTTHLLRILAAFALAVLLQIAKATIYSSQHSSHWQHVLVHLYDVPPVVLLTLVQLSAVGLVARQYKNLPSIIPLKVGSDTEHIYMYVCIYVCIYVCVYNHVADSWIVMFDMLHYRC